MKTFKRLFMLTLMATMLVTIPGNIKAAEPLPNPNPPTAADDTVDNIEVKSSTDIVGCTVDEQGKVRIDVESCFVDTTFREIVYNAVFKDDVEKGKGTATYTDTNMKTLLADYTGDIIANAKTIKKKDQEINKGILIKSAFGLQFLREANIVDLEHNEISDWTVLTATGKFSLDYYGYAKGENAESQDRKEGNNVLWKIGGNPFKLLPEHFGGNLVIAQAATTHSEYITEDTPVFSFPRNVDISQINGKILVRQAQIKKNKENSTDPDVVQDVPIISIATPPRYQEPYRNFISNIGMPDKDGNSMFTLNNLDTSGQEMIAVGIDEVIKYYTDDEYHTSTPGEQSFKYYLHPYFYVYDKLTVETKDIASIVFTKKDSADETILLPGAVYKLIKPDGSDISFTTNEKGQFILDVSDVGEYTLEETTPPIGYDKSNDIIKFKVVAPTNTGTTVTISINGGTDKFTSSQDSKEMTADDDPTNIDAVYLGGKFDKDLQTNKEISFETKSADDVKKVIVTYASLFDGTIAHETVKTFSNTNGTALTDAATDINTQNTTGMLRGDVKVEVVLEDHILDMNDQAIHELSQTNTKTPPVEPEDPDTPGRPHKPSDPKDPEEPEIPLIPLEPSTPIEPVEPGPNTPEPPTPGVNTSDSSNPSLWISLMLIASGIMVVVYRKKKQYN